MCMLSHRENVERFLRKHRNHRQVTVYKIVDANKKYCSPASPIVIQYQPGCNQSNARTNKLHKKKLCAITKGIHVCLTKDEAEYYSSFLSGTNTQSLKIIKGTALIEDLLGVNNMNNRAVFKKVYFPKTQFPQ